MATTALAQTTDLVRDDETLIHVEDTPLFTVIRDNHFIELTWNQLTDSERRQIYVNMFNPCGF